MDTVVILPLTAGQQIWVESQMSDIEGADNTYGLFSWFFRPSYFRAIMERWITDQNLEIISEYLKFGIKRYRIYSTEMLYNIGEIK